MQSLHRTNRVLNIRAGILSLLLFSPDLVQAQTTIYLRGIVNAASSAPAGLPSGGIARGSMFTIYGASLGPALGVQASSFPLGVTLAGVSVKVTQGTTQVDALPVYASATQINAIMPSTAPLGMVSARVTFNGIPSNPAPVRVVDSSFAFYTISGTGNGPGIMQNFVTTDSQPLNTAKVTAKPGQVVTTYGTGLGAIAAADNQPPPVGNLPVAVEVTVGGQPAKVLYSGRASCCSALDQLVFQLPDNVPSGCWVPVYARTNNAVTSNAVTIAIDPNGGPCQEPLNPLAATFFAGGKAGMVRLLRSSTRMDVDVKAPVESANDFFHFDLAQAKGGDFSFSPMFSQPPAGSCTVFFSAGNPLKSDPISAAVSRLKSLDAGSSFTLAGANLSKVLTPDLGSNAVLLGSFAPVAPGLPNQLTLNPGDYTISSSGGADVPPFSVKTTLPPAFTWTGRDSLGSIDRSQPLPLAWSGVPAGQSVAILATSVDFPTNSSAGFYCTAAPDASGFTVPSAVVSVLPPSRTTVRRSQSAIYLITATPRNAVSFNPAGLDSAAVVAGHMIGKTVVIR